MALLGYHPDQNLASTLEPGLSHHSLHGGVWIDFLVFSLPVSALIFKLACLTSQWVPEDSFWVPYLLEHLMSRGFPSALLTWTWMASWWSVTAPNLCFDPFLDHIDFLKSFKTQILLLCIEARIIVRGIYWEFWILHPCRVWVFRMLFGHVPL